MMKLCRVWKRSAAQKSALNLRRRGEHFSLSAFCEVGGAKWGEGRGEVHQFITLRHSFSITSRKTCASSQLFLNVESL